MKLVDGTTEDSAGRDRDRSRGMIGRRRRVDVVTAIVLLWPVCVVCIFLVVYREIRV